AISRMLESVGGVLNQPESLLLGEAASDQSLGHLEQRHFRTDGREQEMRPAVCHLHLGEDREALAGGIETALRLSHDGPRRQAAHTGGKNSMKNGVTPLLGQALRMSP